MPPARAPSRGQRGQALGPPREKPRMPPHILQAHARGRHRAHGASAPSCQCRGVYVDPGNPFPPADDDRKVRGDHRRVVHGCRYYTCRCPAATPEIDGRAVVHAHRRQHQRIGEARVGQQRTRTVRCRAAAASQRRRHAEDLRQFGDRLERASSFAPRPGRPRHSRHPSAPPAGWVRVAIAPIQDRPGQSGRRIAGLAQHERPQQLGGAALRSILAASSRTSTSTSTPRTTTRCAGRPATQRRAGSGSSIRDTAYSTRRAASRWRPARARLPLPHGLDPGRQGVTRHQGRSAGSTSHITISNAAPRAWAVIGRSHAVAGGHQE